MNTKTNHEYASNSYNEGIMGSDSPAALLDMLAEVASQTLNSEKKRNKLLILPPQCKSKADHVKRKSHESSFNVPQLLSMPTTQLIKLFSIFTSDELKRQYSYTCALIVGCGQKYTSFASEERARMSIKIHLAEHLEYLESNKEAYKTFIAKSVGHKSYKANAQNKKGRFQQLRKPQETLNKENKNIITEKPTNYLRSILLNDSTFKELDKNKNVEKRENSKKVHNAEDKDTDIIDSKTFGDHSYSERLKEENPNEKEAPYNNNPGTTSDENIVLMVVGTDSVHMKEYTHIKKKLPEKSNKKSEDISWSNEDNDKHTEITITKPKGKAKFIGTSKEEREMALAFMERIKKKGNPTGNNLECRICNPPRSFTAPTTLVSHYRSHAGIKPYECRICRAVFTRRHSLKYHMLIHQNQTRFTCADCGKKFRHPSHFREHRRRHTGEAPFGCDDCGQRFKTRNTYKRHLKTRHGKVLTTTGELLYLSEEDFQKVKTNRKKKNDINKDYVMDDDVSATNTIIRYENESGATKEEYIINNDDTDSDKNWESSNTIKVIENCFETYEVCPESHSDKTDSVETEIPIGNRTSNKDEDSSSDQYTDEVHNKSQHLQGTSYIKLEVIEDDNVCHNSTGQHEIIYHDINQASPYIRVEYNDFVNDIVTTDSLELDESFELSEQQLNNRAQITDDNEENYFDFGSNDAVDELQASTRTKLNDTNKDKHIIVTQEDIRYEKQDSDINTLNCKSFDELTHEVTMSEELISLNALEDVNVVTDKVMSVQNTSADQDESCTIQADNQLHSYQTVITNLINNRVTPSSNFISEEGKKASNSMEQRLYLHNEPIASIIVQDKCINILPQIKPRKQLNKRQKFTLFNKHMQAVNIKQNGNQNTILFLTSDTLQNNVFKVDQNSTANNGIKKGRVEKSK
ncbi:uncharacterized protein LOC108622873 isoform X2 [Ceratina calcarata]|uniref:Uncharacterized protein LOC108622873 isoform X2 n=1 Tax=Ceratina calcarata TaxID=156304 RepID=A0AAJ7IT84_9HYME|nr:uncharacterized protein LOC108622873 isoform X2 [Ceratina calcarata]